MGRKEFYKDGQLIRVEDDRVLEEEKEKEIARYKKMMNKKLSETDWMVVREYERHVPTPGDVSLARSELISTMHSIEEDIEDITTMNEWDAFYRFSEILTLCRES